MHSSIVRASFPGGSSSPPSYLLGAPGSAVAVVIDPGGDVERYLEAAERCGLRIEHAIATDPRALLPPLYELKRRVGARLHGRAAGPPLYGINALLPGSTFAFGRIRFRLPGSSRGRESLFVYDLDLTPERPVLVTRHEDSTEDVCTSPRRTS